MRINGHRKRIVALAATIVLAIAPGTVLGQAATEPSARQHFARGYELTRDGAFDAAVIEFERAYAIEPHFSVLYNLGQAYASLGQSARAVQALERYLALGGNAIPEARRAQVRDTIQYHAQRVGTLRLELEPADASVSVDGRKLDASVSRAPIRLDAGVHGLVAERPGFALKALSIVIAGGRESRARILLEPLPPGRLSTACPLLDVRLLLNGRERTLTSSGVLIAPGRHRISFERRGYVTRELTFEARPGAIISIPCGLAPDPRSAELAELMVRHPPGARVWVDGAPFTTPRIPPGRHRLSVFGPGFVPDERIVSLAPNSRLGVDIQLQRSTNTLLLEQTQRQRTRRIVAYAIGGTGLAALAGAASIYVLNNQAHADWQKDNDELVTRLRDNPESVHPRELDTLLRDENRIRNRDNLVVGLATAGLLSLATAAALWLYSGEPALVVSPSAIRARSSF
jgi:hypothetical protein